MNNRRRTQTRQRDRMPAAELVQRRAVLPYFRQRIMVDAPQFAVGQHGAWNNYAVGAHGNLTARAAARGEATPIEERPAAPCARASSIRRQTRPSANGPALAEMRPGYFSVRRSNVAMANWRSCNVQHNIIRIQAACAQVTGRVGAKTRQAQFFQKEVSDIFQIVNIMIR
jgi:hypothetical protein